MNDAPRDLVVQPSELAAAPLFKGLSSEECDQIAQAGCLMVFQHGDAIVRQGEHDQSMWIILEGTCRVIKESASDGPDPIELATLEHPDNFGEMSFFHVAPHSASVIAEGKVRVFRLQREQYDGLIQANCRSAYKLALNTVESLAGRLRRMDGWISELLEHPRYRPRVVEWEHFRDKLFKGWNL
jgi:CRP-like cAMP-binding protein